MLRKILKAGCRVGSWTAIGLVVAALADSTEIRLATLKVGSEVYSNVTVTSVTTTDVYFTHAGGIGNAKLKKLDPDLQRFGFDSAKAGTMERQQLVANAQFRADIAKSKPAISKSESPGVTEKEISYDDGDIVVNKLYAQSFRGQRPPQIFVDQWLTPAPEVSDKFVLVDFWRTSEATCRNAVPHLNDLQAKFKKHLVVIGLSDEAPEEMRKMSMPRVNYYVGSDAQGRTMKAVGVTGIPHSILIDPKGIVRYEGVSAFLDETRLAALIIKYSE